MTGVVGTGIPLQRTTGTAHDDAIRAPARDTQTVVAAATVDHDHFIAASAQFLQGGKGPGEDWSRVENRDDDTDGT